MNSHCKENGMRDKYHFKFYVLCFVNKKTDFSTFEWLSLKFCMVTHLVLPSSILFFGTKNAISCVTALHWMRFLKSDFNVGVSYEVFVLLVG